MVNVTDIVVKIELDDPSSETRLFQAIDQFATSQSDRNERAGGAGDAPAIMIKTVPDGDLRKKTVIFQNQEAAEEFLYFWRRLRQAS